MTSAAPDRLGSRRTPRHNRRRFYPFVDRDITLAEPDHQDGPAVVTSAYILGN